MIANSVKKAKKFSVFFAIILFLAPYVSFADVTQSSVVQSQNTDYVNTTGYPLFVGITCFDGGVGGAHAFLHAYSDVTFYSNTMVAEQDVFLTSQAAYVFWAVPNGYHYGFSCSTTGTSPVLSEFQWVMASTSSGVVNNSTTTILSVAASSSLPIDNATEDYFFGVVVLIVSMWFMVWLFRKHR